MANNKQTIAGHPARKAYYTAGYTRTQKNKLRRAKAAALPLTRDQQDAADRRAFLRLERNNAKGIPRPRATRGSNFQPTWTPWKMGLPVPA